MSNHSNPTVSSTPQNPEINHPVAQPTDKPTPISQKLAELQETNATRVRISNLEAALDKQYQKIAQIMSHIEVLKQETQHNLGRAYSTIDLMYAAIPMMELNLRIM